MNVSAFSLMLRWVTLLTLAFSASAPDLLAQEPAKSTPGTNSAPANPSQGPAWMRDPERVHDPSTIMRVDGVYRCFCTGPGVSVMREDAPGRWLRDGRIFDEGKFPAWHNERIPGNRGYLWAPDVIMIDGKFFVYYSVSTFGKNTSAIGLAVGSSLDPSSPQWRWVDRGAVILSGSSNRFNAIDPAIFREATNGSLWMTFGSFWDGIHLVELDPATGLRRHPEQAPLRLAYAPEIEAPFVHKREGYYYLFVNWGKCCRGVESTYDLRVGRSRTVTGPYLDRNETDMRERGGTLVLAGVDRWVGPGHASIHEREGGQWLVHHCYDRAVDGRPRLRMVPLTWDDEGWPLVAPAK